MAWLARWSHWPHRREEAIYGWANGNVGDRVGAPVSHFSWPRPGQWMASKPRPILSSSRDPTSIWCPAGGAERPDNGRRGGWSAAGTAGYTRPALD